MHKTVKNKYVRLPEKIDEEILQDNLCVDTIGNYVIYRKGKR